jgi:hypothetical protein
MEANTIAQERTLFPAQSQQKKRAPGTKLDYRTTRRIP